APRIPRWTRPSTGPPHVPQNHSTRSPPYPTDELVHRLQGLIHAAGLFRASLGQLGTAAPTAAGGLGDFLDQPPGMEPRNQVLTHGSHQVDLAVQDAGDTNDARAKPLAQPVHHGTQAFGIEPIDTTRNDGDAVDLAGTVHQLIGARSR